MSPITDEQIDAILPYLDHFEAAGPSYGIRYEPSSDPNVITLPRFRFDETAGAFFRALYDHGWIATDFDWGGWIDAAQQLTETPGAIEAADAETIRKLLTTHVRYDRFCDDHLAVVFAEGHMVRLLRRLRAIRETRLSPQPARTP
ncbi:DUF6508 domain-containing protein [Planctomyces sp. SH-PL62]|uniref:DUF6508 domain-containing protein n=1 Tax=Planctomyces sp. SH-PL62 TaxID=1636152 RepID=UPI00078E701C|nr:DUF6508 domain-containing protein [Planctomyces sp. SH-PL62]AMV40445.1 hypothetical protein VT85_23645 [Planctomyces sp. SH-PL62]